MINKDRTNREHDAVVIAVHKDTGKLFGGKAQGTHIGYPKLAFLKRAMTAHYVDHEDYIFLQLSFNEQLVPELRLLQGEDHATPGLRYKGSSDYLVENPI